MNLPSWPIALSAAVAVCLGACGGSSASPDSSGGGSSGGASSSGGSSSGGGASSGGSHPPACVGCVDITDRLPYSDSLSTTAEQRRYILRAPQLGVVYAVTLHTDTPGAMIDIELCPDAAFSHRVAWGTAVSIQDEALFVTATQSTSYVRVSLRQGAEVAYTLDVEPYAAYAGLTELTGALPHPVALGPDGSLRFIVRGLTPGRAYTVSLADVTNDTVIVGAYASEQALADEHPSLCWTYVQGGSWSCSATAPETGALYVSIDNKTGWDVTGVLDVR